MGRWFQLRNLRAFNLAAGQSKSVTFAALVDANTPNGTVLHSVAIVTVSSGPGGGTSATSDVAVRNQ
jgi:hypothetical protein